MTYREMLELAAKAAGYVLKWHHDGSCAYIQDQIGYWRVWNPLSSDGDALRLAVKLGIQIDPRDPETRVYGPVGEVVRAYHKPDPDAATRLAITRAAAEIGRSMK